MGSTVESLSEGGRRTFAQKMMTFKIMVLFAAGAAICNGWMRPRVGGMSRFGRSGDGLEDDIEDGGDYSEVGDYAYPAAADILARMEEKRNMASLVKQGKRNMASLHGKRGGNWFLRSRGLGK